MVGSRGRPKKPQNKTDKVVLLCVFRYSTPLQAVDIINISAAFPQRRPLPQLGGLNRFTCWKALGRTGEETGRQT